MKLVEFIGIPGSGKTTLANGLLDQCGGTGRHALGRSWRSRSLGARALDCASSMSPRMLASMASLTGMAGVAEMRRLLALPLRSHWVRQQQGLMLMDQGMLQQLWSINFAARDKLMDPARLADVIAELYRGIPTLIVNVEIDEEAALGRIALRENGHSQIDRAAMEARRAMVSRAAAIHRLVLCAAGEAGLEVVAIDGRDEPSRLQQEVAAMLAGLSCTGGRPGDGTRLAASALVQTST